jgi:ribose transport system substrate-binding protein
MQAINAYALIFACVAVLGMAALMLVAANSFRSRRRVFTARLGLVLFVLSLIGIVVGLGSKFNVSFSDNLAIVGLLLPFAFTVGAAMIDRAFQEMTVAIVIPSRVAFHVDLRRGLRDELRGQKVHFIDEFAGGTSLENQSEFPALFRRAVSQRPDYIVIVPPGSAFVDQPEVLEEVEKVVRLGGRVFMVENGPTQLSQRAQKGVAVIRSDSTAGAEVLGRYIATIWDRSSPIAVIAGPAESAPARKRLEVLKAQVKVPENLIVRSDMSGWSSTSGYEFSKEVLGKHKATSIIICGNDSMAIGAARAVSELNLHSHLLRNYKNSTVTIWRRDRLADR